MPVDKIFHRPGPQTFQGRILEFSWRPYMGHAHQLLDRIQEPEGSIGRILVDQIPAELPGNIIARKRAKNRFHDRFRALCFAAMPRASVLRSFQNSGVNRPSPSRCPNR